MGKDHIVQCALHTLRKCLMRSRTCRTFTKHSEESAWKKTSDLGEWTKCERQCLGL